MLVYHVGLKVITTLEGVMAKIRMFNSAI